MLRCIGRLELVYSASQGLRTAERLGFHDNCPAAVKPSTGKANAKELSFDVLDSGYDHRR